MKRSILGLAADAVRGVVMFSFAAGCDVRAYPLRDDMPPNGFCPTDLVGFATQGDAPTTGGGNAAPVTVTTLDDFQTYAGMTGPAVIQVSGMIAFPTVEGTDGQQVDITPDKTILGMGPRSGFTGGGLRVKDSQNVIIRNLVIAKAANTDAITLQASKNIWVDHCDLSSDITDTAAYDSLIDITHATDFVTVSWTLYHNHGDTGIIGHSADNGAEDTGHLTVTYHHNFFQNIESGPTARFGTVHVYNNYFDQVSNHALVSRSGAVMLVQNNQFEYVVLPIATVFNDPLPGSVADVGNVVDATDGTSIITTPKATWSPPYPYTADMTTNAVALLQFCAGTGKI